MLISQARTSNRAYRAGYPPEYRLLPFGGWGLVVYLVREQRGAVVLLEVTWAGT